jgi:dynamin 1-like protein
VVDESIRSCVAPTKEFINNVIDNEKSLINCFRPDFRGKGAIHALASSEPRTRIPPQRYGRTDPSGICSIYGSSLDFSSHQGPELRDIRTTADRYFNVIRDQVSDLVPKAIVKFLIRKSSDVLREKMTLAILNSKDVLDALKEDPGITKKRIACDQIVKALRKSQQILNQIRSLKI